MRKKVVKISIIVISVITFIVISVLFIRFEIDLLFHESLDVEKGSIKYHLTFPPKLLKKAPIISNINAPRYDYSVGDGAAPGYYVIYYLSSNSIENIENDINRYFVENGYSIVAKSLGERTIVDFERPNESEVQVTFVFNEELNAVFVKYTFWN